VTQVQVEPQTSRFRLWPMSMKFRGNQAKSPSAFSPKVLCRRTVGATGFEPATSRSRSASRTELAATKPTCIVDFTLFRPICKIAYYTAKLSEECVYFGLEVCSKCVVRGGPENRSASGIPHPRLVVPQPRTLDWRVSDRSAGRVARSFNPRALTRLEQRVPTASVFRARRSPPLQDVPDESAAQRHALMRDLGFEPSSQAST